ncbi:hypothetical protein A2641_02030 [Candidatus Nomurabacteria bacterium RIFCSPHIGHO2_01_FULL_37_25]|nr:MAG: hypothetical protein A2641_02030 [Candidatus Nomurabacteria bacterium RIFCSPHIGHO2_01_FULL_37_25]OGI75770.1 MAG: hypothetical protein A3D36_00190 [Candidatus Nomurabacteria bacterium RIFCSPHIGHO2_02_FULL_36_29]
MEATDKLFYIAVLIMSVVIHEVSHGFVAEWFGDKTARFAGRLTLNPLPHVDLFGSIILPAVLLLSNSPFLFGWAKPVPYNPDNLSNKKWGTIAVAGAGVLANFSIAIIFGAIIRLSTNFSLPEGFYFITSIIVIINLALGVFNLVPIPPLDGSKILFSLLPYSFSKIVLFFEQYSIFLFIIFIYYFFVYFSDYLYSILVFLFTLITGLAI